MNEGQILSTTIELDLAGVKQRFLEIIPGILSWSALIGLTLLTFIVPFWIAVFIIVYDVYVLIRAMYMSVHLVFAYGRLKKMKKIYWLERCKRVSDGVVKYLGEVENEIKQQGKNWQQQQLLSELKLLKKKNVKVRPWDSVHHIVVLPTYNESVEVLKTSIDSLARSDFPKDRMHVVVGFEKRVGESARQKAAVLQDEFKDKFATFHITFHPDGLEGEARVKSANATWAMKEVEKIVLGKGVEIDNILVSNFDSDTVAGQNYFAYLTYVFITLPDRYRVSYQPLPMYHNNIWDAPAFSRIIATGSTFWQMIESTRPERLVTFSSHSMTLKALREVGYWHKDKISEDSRIFWQCLLKYDGNYRTEPLYTSVSLDAALADTWWQTLKNQYKQKRRWAWGIENFPYMATGFLRNSRIRFRTKVLYIFRTLEGHFSWVTTPIIVAGLGWLPIIFGSPQFHSTVLSFSLPFVARTIMSVAMVGLLISTTLSLILLPKKPSYVSRWRYFQIICQWAVFPFIAIVLSAAPALDAETRMMLGRDLQFNVTQKSRKTK